MTNVRSSPSGPEVAVPTVPVDSVFGRTGDVVAASGDYNSDEVDNASGVPGASVSDSLNQLAADIAAIPAAPVDSVFGRTGAVVATAGDYTSSQVANASGVAGASVSAALDQLDADIAAIPPAPVDSVFGRTGAVVATSGDYNSNEVTNASGVAGASVSAALDQLAADIAAIPPAPVDSVFGRTGAVIATAGDYTSSQVANASGVAGASVSAALDQLDADIAAIPPAPVDSVFGRTGNVVAASGDYNSDEVDNASGVSGASVSDSLDQLAADIAAIPPAPVNSVFGRTGAVVATSGDYDSNEVTNASGVAGASVSAALDQLDAAIAAIPIPSTEVSNIGYTAAAPLNLTLLAAGHTPGLYSVCLDLLITAAATTGTLSRNYSYSAPSVGAVNTASAGVLPITSTGRPLPPTNVADRTLFFNPLYVRSDGSAAIVLNITPSSVTGSPAIDIYASATLMATP